MSRRTDARGGLELPQISRRACVGALALAFQTAFSRAAPAEVSDCTLDVPARPVWLTPWSDEFPEVVAQLAMGEPLVALVYVPLCSNEQVDCGSSVAGRAGDLSTNLYWGAGFGAARFFDRAKSGWTRLDVRALSGPELEQRVYERNVPRRAWRGSFERLTGNCSAATGDVKQIVILRAVHGGEIDQAVLSFFRDSTAGSTINVPLGTAGTRRMKAHIVGYAGHNRLMDGLELPATNAADASHGAASFVLACHSQSYFEDSLRGAGSTPLVMTRDLMAPEGYVIDAVLRALGENATKPMLRQRVVRAYARWQQIPEERASLIFAR